MRVLESVPTVLTQPGTPVSFRGMLFTCYSISGNSGFSDVFHFRETLELRSLPLFHILFSFMYSDLLSVPGTYLFHSLAYKYLYSVAKTSELRLLPPLLCSPSRSSFLSSLRDLEDLSPHSLTSSTLLVTRFLDPEIPTLTRTRKSGIPEGFHREQGNTMSPPR